MTLKELINRHPWAAVKYRLMERYPLGDLEEELGGGDDQRGENRT